MLDGLGDVSYGLGNLSDGLGKVSRWSRKGVRCSQEGVRLQCIAAYSSKEGRKGEEEKHLHNNMKEKYVTANNKKNLVSGLALLNCEHVK